MLEKGFVRYGCVVLLCALAVLLGSASGANASSFMLAIIVASLYGDRWSSLLAVGLSIAAFDFFFMDPRYQLAVIWGQAPRLGIFSGVAVLVRFLILSRRRIDARARSIVDAVPIAVLSLDAHGRITSANPACGETFGYGTGDLVGMHISAILPEFELQPCSGTALEARRRDGSPLAVEAGFQRMNPEGERTTWTGFVRDRSAERLAERALRQNEERLRETIDSIPGMVFVGSSDARMEYVNARVLQLTGRRFEDLEGYRYREVIHPDDADAVLAELDRAVRSRTPYHAVLRLQRYDGQYLWIDSSAHPVLDADGNVRRWYGLNIEVDALKNAEDALRESEARFRLMLDMIPALVWSTDAQARTLAVNKRMSEYTGYSCEQLRDRAAALEARGESPLLQWLEMAHPDDCERVLSVHRRATEIGEPFSLDLRLRRHDGVYRWFEVRGEPLRSDNGEVVSWYGLSMDVEDARALERQLRTTQSRLERAMRAGAVSELSASIAHEINQPLTSVIADAEACARWLSSERPNIERAKRSASSIVQNARDAADIVHRIRALFQREPLDRRPVNLNAIIQQVLQLLSERFLQSATAIRLELEEELPLVMADQLRLQQVLVNLIQNGIEAMQDDVAAGRLLIVRSGYDGRQVIVEVEDQGPGIADVGKAFETFFTTKPTGMGMGLPISRSIIEAHQGTLTAKSSQSTGAVFRFTLPLYASASARHRSDDAGGRALISALDAIAPSSL